MRINRNPKGKRSTDLRPVAQYLSPEQLRARHERRVKLDEQKLKRALAKRLTPEELRPGQTVGFRSRDVRILDRFDAQTFLVTTGPVFTVKKSALKKRTGH